MKVKITFKNGDNTIYESVAAVKIIQSAYKDYYQLIAGSFTTEFEAANVANILVTYE